MDLTKEIASTLGFSYVIKLVDDNKYGEKMENGTWNGMIGELTKKVRGLREKRGGGGGGRRGWKEGVEGGGGRRGWKEGGGGERKGGGGRGERLKKEWLGF